MTWVRIDDHFDQHPKLATVGPLGIALWVAGLAYCNRNLTDGFIPWGTAQSLLAWEFLGGVEERGRKRFQVAVTCGMSGDDVTADFVIRLLTDAGLWEEADGGYRVHDYGDYQPSKEEVLAERAKTRERVAKFRNAQSNGVTNGDVTANVTSAKSAVQGRGTRVSPANADENPNIASSLNLADSGNVGRNGVTNGDVTLPPVPVPVPVPLTPTEETSVSSSGVVAQAPKPPRRTRAGIEVMTDEQFADLAGKYGSEFVRGKLEYGRNRQDWETKHKSEYLTVKRWCEQDTGQGNPDVDALTKSDPDARRRKFLGGSLGALVRYE